MKLRCARCGGVWHPATGALYRRRTRVCGPCERAFWRWVKGWTRGRKGKADFYAAAGRR